MTVESATFVGDLQPLQPPSTDPRGQGDDHLRLIKQVLQNSFPNMERAFYIPNVQSKSANYSIVAADGETTFYTDTTSGAVTYTLPSTLATTDAGWQVHFIKTNAGANPIFIAPATGTLTSGYVAGLAKARRGLAGVKVSAFWNGTGWLITRALGVPIGSTLELNTGTLPPGYEWANGQTLTSASTNYPEYNSVMGTVCPDHRGRAVVTNDVLGGLDAGRLAVTNCSLASVRGTVGGAGGSAVSQLFTANLPAYTPSSSLSVTFPSTIGGEPPNFVTPGGNPIGYGGSSTGASLFSLAGVQMDVSQTFVAQGGTSTTFDNCQPSIICNKIVVVE